jgi:hypothetical protein
MNRSDISNNRDNWNHFKIIQKIPEQPTGKVRYQRTIEHNHIAHCTCTAERTSVKAHSIQRGK